MSSLIAHGRLGTWRSDRTTAESCAVLDVLSYGVRREHWGRAVHQFLRQKRAKKHGQSILSRWAGFGLPPSLSSYEYGEGLLHARRLGSTAALGPHDSPRRRLLHKRQPNVTSALVDWLGSALFILTDMVRRVDPGMTSQADGISTFHGPAHDMTSDLSAWDPTMNRCSLDNKSGSGSAADLGTCGPTIDPSLLTVHDEFNEVGDNISYITGNSGDETTG
jgi:hypothetical protein